MQSMDNLMIVPENTSEIIGKFFYYSLANILIPKEQFIRVGMDFGLPKFKPAKESKAGAYRNATTALKERVVVKGSTGTQVYRIYCRDNKKEDAVHIYRELVKETQNARTNEYKKLANIVFDKKPKPCSAKAKPTIRMWTCRTTASGRSPSMNGIVPATSSTMWTR